VIDDLRREMMGYLRGRPQQRWKWIRHGDRRLINVVFRADGTATADDGSTHEPVLEEVALAALVTANRDLNAERSAAARKAAETRKKRHDRRVYAIVEALRHGQQLTPSGKCRCCGKGLTDDESRRRGIGSECWQGVLRALEARK
jgi:hypothetical protein